MIVNVKEAAKRLAEKKNIMILTGAGLSAASGIPTFRGDEGIWTKLRQQHKDPTSLLTMRNFMKNPELIWHWTYELINVKNQSKPNPGHFAIQNYL